MSTVDTPTAAELEEVTEARASYVEDLETVLTLVYEVIDDISEHEHAALGRLGRYIDAGVETDGPVLAASSWPTNAHMVEDLVELGYLRESDHVLDPTYERGVWWRRWQPERLTTCHRSTDGTDFRDLPFESHTFDAVAYDPPYVCPGGRSTSTIPEFHDRFGMAEGGHEDPLFSTPAELQQLIDDGLAEMVRLVKPGGLILTKCQDYVWGGRLWEGATLTRNTAVALGCTVVDRLEHIGHARPQPAKNPDGSARRQVHARRNLSTLWVFRAPKLPAAQGRLV